jgi:hypothetical protein
LRTVLYLVLVFQQLQRRAERSAIILILILINDGRKRRKRDREKRGDGGKERTKVSPVLAGATFEGG